LASPCARAIISPVERAVNESSKNNRFRMPVTLDVVDFGQNTFDAMQPNAGTQSESCWQNAQRFGHPRDVMMLVARSPAICRVYLEKSNTSRAGTGCNPDLRSGGGSAKRCHVHRATGARQGMPLRLLQQRPNRTTSSIPWSLRMGELRRKRSTLPDHVLSVQRVAVS